MIRLLLLTFAFFIAESSAQAEDFDYLYWSSKKIVTGAATERKHDLFFFNDRLHLAYFKLDRSRTSEAQPLVIESLDSERFTPLSKVQKAKINKGHSLNFYSLHDQLYLTAGSDSSAVTLKLDPLKNTWSPKTGLPLPAKMLRFSIYQEGSFHYLLFSRENLEQHHLHIYKDGKVIQKTPLPAIETSLPPALEILSENEVSIHFIDDLENHWLKKVSVIEGRVLPPQVTQKFVSTKHLVRAQPNVIATRFGVILVLQNLIGGEQNFFVTEAKKKLQEIYSLPKEKGFLHAKFLRKSKTSGWVRSVVVADGRIRISKLSSDDTVKNGLFFKLFQ